MKPQGKTGGGGNHGRSRQERGSDGRLMRERLVGEAGACNPETDSFLGLNQAVTPRHGMHAGGRVCRNEVLREAFPLFRPHVASRQIPGLQERSAWRHATPARDCPRGILAVKITQAQAPSDGVVILPWRHVATRKAHAEPRVPPRLQSPERVPALPDLGPVGRMQYAETVAAARPY